MSTFKNIQGKNIRSYTTNAPNATAGEMWYNQSELKLKGVEAVSAWASSSPLATAKHSVMGSGTQTAALAAGGATPTYTNATEEYNGSGWSGGGNMGTARGAGGSCGTQTATLIFGGYYTPPGSYKTETELYNGTSWAEQPDISTARYNQGNGVGTSTAALYFGGYNGTNLNNTEEYNGSSWTAGGVYPTTARDLGGAGTQTAALGMGGYTPPAPGSKTLGLSCTYDGSSWSSGPTMNTGRSQLACGGSSQTAGIGAGGYRTPTTAVTNVTETFDGTSFTETADLATARRTYGARSGTTSAFLAFGGSTDSTPVSLTEEFTTSANIITAAAWASGPNINTARRGLNLGGVGSNTAGLVFGGAMPPGTLNATEEYNGNSWTSTGNYPVSVQNVGSAGIQTAAVGFGGSPGSGNTATAADYDGSSWTAITSMPTATWQPSGTGTASAALASGGTTPSSASVTQTLEWDNSSWTSGGALSTGRRYFAGFGSQTDSVASGGMTAPGSIIANTEEYGGSSWTAGGAMVTTIRSHCASAQSSSSAGMDINGTLDNSNSTTGTFIYDGTSWRTNANTATARLEAAAIGNSTAAVAIAGLAPWPSPGARLNTTEEFTGETTAVNIVDITTS